MHDLSHIPLEKFVGDGNTLMAWLGNFWSQVFTQPDLVKHYQYGNALNLAQVYLNFVEALDLTDRNNAPVFHRERWQPITIKKSQRDQGKANLLRTDMDPAPYIGPQPPESPYAPGKTFEIGGNAEYVDVVSYPLDEGVVDVLTCVADNILMPNRVLIRGIDFFVHNNTIFFLRDGDPFDSGNFPVKVYDGDEEVLLWASNTLVEKDYLYEHMGYALSVRRPQSSQFYKQMLNGLWDLYNMGTPLEWFTRGVGAMLGEPTVKHEGEVVEVINATDDWLMVITDKEVYRLNTNATLRARVTVGSILHAGELLTETVRIYETLDPRKLAAVSEFGERMRTDIYSLFLGPAFFRSRLALGIGATWATSDIIKDGVDANGNPQLRFELHGTEADIEQFWQDFWTNAAASGTSSEACFSEYLDDIVVPVNEESVPADGTVYGRVPPLEYFMRYFLHGNAMVVLVERDKLSAPDPDHDPLETLSLLKAVLPAHIVVFIIEQRNVGPDEYNLAVVDPDSEDYDGNGGTRHVIDPMIATTLSDEIREGGPLALAMTYKVRPPVMRWIPTCKE